MVSPDRESAQDDMRLDVPPPLTRAQRERLGVVRGVFDRIYESDELAEAEKRQASGEAEIAYDTFNPNDNNRRPLFSDQIILNRDGVLYGFHPRSEKYPRARGVDISPPVDVRGRRIITTTVFVISSEPAGITIIINPITGDEKFVTHLPSESLRLLETVATVFSEDPAPPEQATTPAQ